ncbi:MAG: glutamate 5-kinase [Campylobacteraceae bacterium]|jgi:glutamate 5-kinase|nr:glutamate 5-kinase [Campylobacteraceae bacterium]
MKKRIVIKVGTHVLTEKGKLCVPRFEKLVEFLVLAMEKYEVILVSSGAVATGFSKIKLDKKIVSDKQALAAIGQPYLIQYYNEFLQKHGKFGAQILLVSDDFDSRKRTKAARDAINALLKNNILPIINENDTVGVEEIVFGDNDQLSAHVTHFFDADILIILSDINGYYDADPKENQNAKLILHIDNINESELHKNINVGSEFSTGGIVTKLKAADFLLKNGRSMFLASGFDLSDAKNFILKNKHSGGTLFAPKNRLK